MYGRTAENPVDDNDPASGTDTMQVVGKVTTLIHIFSSQADTACLHDAMLEEETGTIGVPNSVLQFKLH